MTEVLSVFGVQTANDKEQLLIRYPNGRLETINGPAVRWVQPGATVEKRSAVVMDAFQYCLLENSQNEEAVRIERGPQVLFLQPEEFSGDVQTALTLQKGEYLRVVDTHTGQERIEVGPNSKGVFPDPHESVVDSAPQRAKHLLEGDAVEILDHTTGLVRVARGPTVLYLASAETTVDQSLLEAAEAEAFAEALARSKQAHPPVPVKPSKQAKTSGTAKAAHAQNGAAARDAKENVPANRPARTADESTMSPRTAVHTFLSQLLGRKKQEPQPSSHNQAASPHQAPQKDLQEPKEQLQSLGRTVRFQGRAGGPTFEQAHETLLSDLETRHNLQPKFVGGKGDCLFCCFLHYDGKRIDAASIKRMRNEIADAIRQVVLDDPYVGVIFASNAGSDSRNGEGVTVEQYIAGIRGRAWGDTVCITQFCRLRQIKARLFTIMNDERVEETDFTVPGARQKPVLQIIHHPDPEDGDMFHYEVLVAKQDTVEQRGITLRQWREDVSKAAVKRKRRA